MNNSNALLSDLSVITSTDTTDPMKLWSEKRRDDFCETFEQKTNFAILILKATVSGLFNEARERHFINMSISLPSRTSVDDIPNVDLKWKRDKLEQCHVYLAYSNSKLLGTRDSAELNEIVAIRLGNLLAELPASLSTIRIIKPETAKKMELLKKVNDKLLILNKELTELSKDIEISDYLGQGLTIDDFVAKMRSIETKKLKVAQRASAISVKYSGLNKEINKDLYGGIPELEKATIKIIEDLFDQIAVLIKLRRNVVESVKFGDSEAAMAILKQFEQDEIELGPAIEAGFKAVMSKLRSTHGLSSGRITKAVKKSKKSKKIK